MNSVKRRNTRLGDTYNGAAVARLLADQLGEDEADLAAEGEGNFRSEIELIFYYAWARRHAVALNGHPNVSRSSDANHVAWQSAGQAATRYGTPKRTFYRRFNRTFNTMIYRVKERTMMLKPRYALLCLNAVVLSLGLSAMHVLAEDESGTAALLGRYHIIAAAQAEESIDQERLDAISVIIDHDTITTLDREGLEIYAAAYSLTNSEQPWEATLTATVAPRGGAGIQTQGLMMLDDGLLNLIYALPGGDAPDDFVPDAGQQLFVLRRADSSALR